jgi:hypothetical protein
MMTPLDDHCDATAKDPAGVHPRSPAQARPFPKLRFPTAWANQSFLRATIVVLWLGTLVVGFAMLADYGNSPCRIEPAPPRWPRACKILPSEQRATLILFAHPHCACTRASLGELEKIVARCQDAVTCWVVFFKPLSVEDDWDQTDLWTTAAAIPGVQVMSDVDGQQARLFHVATSGQALLYDKRGELLFSGGITFARGHAGDNAGRTAIESALAGRSSAFQQAPVYGCPIALPTAE